MDTRHHWFTERPAGHPGERVGPRPGRDVSREMGGRHAGASPVEAWVCIGIWNVQDLPGSRDLTGNSLLDRESTCTKERDAAIKTTDAGKQPEMLLHLPMPKEKALLHFQRFC